MSTENTSQSLRDAIKQAMGYNPAVHGRPAAAAPATPLPALPQRDWTEWMDGDIDDAATSLGFRKNPARLQHDIEALTRAGRTEDAARLRGFLPPAPASKAPAPETKPETGPASFSAALNTPFAYGAGGAGVGALLAAALGKKNRGRNALIGAGLGGGAGLLAHHFMNNKTAAEEKQALVGTTLGVLGGAVSGKPGKRLRAVGRGAVKGVGTDVGAVSGGLLGAGIGGTIGGLATLPLMGIGAIPGAVVGGLGGAATGGRMGYNVTNSMLGPYESEREKFEEQLQNYLARMRHNSPEHEQFSQMLGQYEDDAEAGAHEYDDPKAQAALIAKHKAQTKQEKTSAFDFGKMLGDAGKALYNGVSNVGTYAKDMYNQLPESVRSGIGMGGVGGAALGGLAGMIAPGEDVEYDNFGNVIGRKQRNRFGAALRGAVGGGLAGAAGGAAAGHFAPEQTQQTADYLRNFGEQAALLYRGESLPHGGHKGLHPEGGRAPLDAIELPRKPPSMVVA